MNGTTHQMEYSSTNASAVINSAIGNLTVGRTWKEKVVLMGNFTIDSSIIMPSYTVLELRGKVTATYNPDFPMVRNENQTGGNSYSEIFGGYWEGNNGATLNAGGDIFQIHASGSDKCYYWSIHDLMAVHASDDLFDCYAMRGLIFNIVGYIDSGTRTHGHGFRLHGFSDSMLDNVYAHASKCGAYLHWCSSSLFSNMYFGGSNTDSDSAQFYLFGYGNEINNLRVDSMEKGAGIIVGNNSIDVKDHNTFTNVHVTNPYGSGCNGIIIDRMVNCTWTNVHIYGDLHEKGGLVNGIVEQNNSGGNLYSNLHIHNVTTPLTLDATSYYHNAYLNGTYSSTG